MVDESKLENRLKDIHTGVTPTKETKLKSKLEDSLAEEDTELAADLVRTRAEEKITQRKLSIKQMKDDLRGTKTKEKSDEKSGEKPERWSVVDSKPIKDPDGEYETFAQAYKVAALATQAVAVAAAEKNNPLAIFQFLKAEGLLGSKTDSFAGDLAKRYLDNIDNQLKSAIESKDKTPAEVEVLRNEIASLREEIRQSSDPIESAIRVKKFSDALRDAGVIPAPSTGVGEPLENIKEQHRHQEKLKDIEAEREYRTSISKALGEIPERIGRGIASQISGEEETGSEEGNFQTFNCKECGHKIAVPPEAGPTITCGKCGAIYQRKKEPASNEPKP